MSACQLGPEPQYARAMLLQLLHVMGSSAAAVPLQRFQFFIIFNLLLCFDPVRHAHRHHNGGRSSCAVACAGETTLILSTIVYCALQTTMVARCVSTRIRRHYGSSSNCHARD